MKITHLEATNYRSLEQFELNFSPIFTAVSGRNDSGKSSIFDAIKVLVGSTKYDLYEPVNIDFDRDYPRWKEHTADDEITIAGTFTLEVDDAAMRNFIQRQLNLPSNDIDAFCLRIARKKEDKSQRISATALGVTVEGEPAAEVWRRLRSGGSLVFHNSPPDALRLQWGAHGQISEISQAVGSVMNEIRTQASRRMKRVMASSESEIQGLLGRLSDKWKVSLELPELATEVPFHLALGDSSVSVRLENWGSGTKNRAMIVLALLRAAQARKADRTGGRVVPIVVVEEPESFLHPSAQAEFGSLLIDLSRELDVQVIVATHSVYLLNTDQPEANVLVARKRMRGRARQTVRIDSDDQNWMTPFSEALGLSSESLAPWRSMLQARGRSVVLVEGATDEAYMKMLQDPAHGADGLPADFVFVPYGGFGNITNQAALRVMIQLAGRATITVDLDALVKVQRTFDSLQLRRGLDYLPVGDNKPARRSIEGLLPERVRQDVLHNNPDLFEGLLDRTEDEKSIRNRIKAAYLAEFQKSARPGKDYAGLYRLASQIKKALAGQPQGAVP